jgi:hypothetical protein
MVGSVVKENDIISIVNDNVEMKNIITKHEDKI